MEIKMQKNNISIQEMENRRRASNQALASLRIEGLNPSNECMQIMELYIKGEITYEERHTKIKAHLAQLIAANN